MLVESRYSVKIWIRSEVAERVSQMVGKVPRCERVGIVNVHQGFTWADHSDK